MPTFLWRAEDTFAMEEIDQNLQFHGNTPGPSNEQIYLHLHDLSSNARISAKRANTGETSTFFERAFFYNP